MKRGDPNGLAALSEAAREPLLAADNLYAERAQMLDAEVCRLRLEKQASKHDAEKQTNNSSKNR